ncbi:MAG: class I SAM-dependent methyltransferase [Candidatus Moranbacteria bacterium]|nr:class I SAM-dependent methyltransferase [Candidatus Moranbacteria bacterium]
MYSKKGEFNRKRSEMYASAMKNAYDARKNELKLFDDSFRYGKKFFKIVDFGAGNAFLSNYLADHFSESYVFALDPSLEMLTSNINKRIKSINDIEKINNNSVDAIFSLAAFHHVTNKKMILRKMHQILKKNGLIFIVDVCDKSVNQRFFDEIVSKYSITGHDFDFLNKDWMRYLAKESGFVLKKVKQNEIYWEFENEKQAILFVKNITGLKMRTDKLRNYILTNFEIKKSKSQFLLRWPLGYFVLEKK